MVREQCRVPIRCAKDVPDDAALRTDGEAPDAIPRGLDELDLGLVAPAVAVMHATCDAETVRSTHVICGSARPKGQAWPDAGRTPCTACGTRIMTVPPAR